MSIEVPGWRKTEGVVLVGIWAPESLGVPHTRRWMESVPSAYKWFPSDKQKISKQSIGSNCEEDNCHFKDHEDNQIAEVLVKNDLLDDIHFVVLPKATSLLIATSGGTVTN